MNYFPVFFDLTALRVLVVGGGEVALRKVALLERCGASVYLVAPDILPELKERADAGLMNRIVGCCWSPSRNIRLFPSARAGSSVSIHT